MSNMRLAVDATPLLLRSAGVKTYIYYWLLHLLQNQGGDSVAIFPAIRDLGECVHEGSGRSFLGTWSRIAWLQTANYLGSWAVAPVGRSADVFHSSNQLRRPPRNTRVTATIYDMTCWLLPETHSPANVAATRRFAEWVMRPAAGLIAISESSKLDAVRILDLEPAKIEVIYPGVAEAFFETTPAQASDAATRHSLSKPYLLYVGTIEPRKNIPVLIDAWQQTPATIRDQFDLVLIGSAGWGDLAILDRLRNTPSVRYLGYIPETDMAPLTKAATAFVYPSLYEGFGLPLAQAMAAGIPAITSNVSSMPEVAAGAALLVDPNSPSELAAAITRLLDSPELRASLAAHAAEVAHRYHWDESARRSWGFFHRVAGK